MIYNFVKLERYIYIQVDIVNTSVCNAHYNILPVSILTKSFFIRRTEVHLQINFFYAPGSKLITQREIGFDFE